MKKALILISYFLIFSTILVESKSKSNLKKIHSKQEEIPVSQPEKDSHTKEYYDDLVEKGLRADNLTRGHPPYPFYQKMNFTEENRRRKEILKSFAKKQTKRRLASNDQTLENLGFISLIQNKSSSASNRAMKFITNNIQKDSSQFIIYPYPFNYTDNHKKEPETKSVDEPGVFTLNETAFKGQNFQYIQNISSVKIGKAKGIYDIDIAILSMVYVKSGMEVDLFTEASTFCNYFVNYIGKISTCLDGKNSYLEYKQKYPGKGSVVRVSATDILNETLYDSTTNQLKFKLLIIPDYLSGNEETIFSSKYLISNAREVIKKFQELGGNIITSGKSGYLLEKIGLIPKDTYDSSFLLQTSADKGENKIAGCEDIYKTTPEEQPDFLMQLLCLGYKTRTVLSQTFKVKNIPSNFDSIIKYTNNELTLNYKEDGYQHDIKEKNATYDYILVSKEDGKKGRIFLVNGNPIANTYYFENVRNMILYSMTRDFIYDLKIKFSGENVNPEEELPIPAGEEGVQLLVNYKFYNLYDVPMTNFKLEILFANKLKLIAAPTGCVLKEERATRYSEMNLSDFNHSQYLLCEASSLDKLHSIGDKFKLEITNSTVTQRLVDIPLMHSYFSFKMGTEEIEVYPGIFYAQAAIAALLRGTLNKDPTSTYPMSGCGLYFDLVLNVENKENTLAKDVNFIALIPLVTPLVDGEDEGKVAEVVPVYEKYYRNHNFSYPWKTIDDRGVDYIDYAEVAGKEVCYVDDFDTPVKYSRIERTDESVNYKNKYSLPEDKNVTLDEGAGALKGISPFTLLRQLYFVDSEKFYETAAPRKSLFVNRATEVGAKAYYGTDQIPEGERDIANNKTARVQKAFIRVDTYFYTSIFNQYQLPSGFDGDVLISIDKFEQDSKLEGKILGEIKPEVKIHGHYDSTKDDYDTLQPNQYFNAMRRYANMKQYDPTKPEDLKALQERTNDTLKLTHLMVPNKDSYVRRAGNLYGFKENADEKSGYLEQYPSVKFVYGHSVPLTLDPAITRLGGYVEIILPSGVKFKEDDPVEADRITISADNVAFYLTEYDKDAGAIKLYFRRGLMPNENYGLPSKCEAYLENLDSNTDITVTLKIYELKYDFSSKNLESYYPVNSATTDLTATYKSFYSFPCLYLENKLSRKSSFAEEESRDMYEYELMNPFARYGGYFQELTKHTTVFGSAEAHHRVDPGFQGISAGFSIISNVGTSSIPFAEFLNHGLLMIPGVTSTSRLEWTDIWGRKWAQNLRSVYPDIPPIPPAPRNYIMTTTFELITNTPKPKDQERVIEWQSDESVYIWIQMKMRNTYELYWEPTICRANQRPVIKENNVDYRNPIFIDDAEVEGYVNESYGDEWDVNLGFSSVYGVCYNKDSYMNGTKLNEDIVNGMQKMMTCAATLDPVNLTKCSNWATEQGLPIIKRRPEKVDDDQDTTPGDKWNYSPLIEQYLPDGYINNKMWQLNVEDYSDDQFYKGYPWHLDDCIPNLDNGILKPHDIIAFPLYKGIGYDLTYDRNYSIYKFPQYKGWWSDQLQNKDHSLIAGQQKVSQVAVNQPSLLKDSDWISAHKLKQKAGKEYVINWRLKNLYVCMFNRHRVKVTPGQPKYAFLKNVYMNNVIPILPDLQENDDRYDNFVCKEDEPQYSIYNISQVDNRVYTGNDRDWLYFAAGLRANAMEDINVIMKLDPIDGTKFEGITKIQDGGRFTYWQPPDGPNSYQYYDGNVNTVISKRVDLTILGKVLPTTINTFNTYLYELFDINDEKETNRTYTMTTYMNSHGYGDAATMVYVGGTDATTCRVKAGTFTYVKIVFYNNAGFDWKMKPGAITLNDTAYKVYLNAMNIMKDKVTAVQYPSEYKFMKYEIPKEIEEYVTLTPSQHVMDVSPQFFDLTFNNILTIRDALEGDYYYCLNVSENFPKDLEGKLWEIKMTLDESWFETLPSPNDPTGFHDYHLTIPSIRFGVPISQGENKGKIFYNLGQAKDLVFTFRLYNEFEIKGIKLVDEEIINKLGEAANDKEEKFSKLLQLWEEIPSKEDKINKIKISFVPYERDTFYNLYTVNLTEAYPLFPYEEAPNKPFVSRLYLLVQSYSAHSPFGYKNLVTSTRITYNDGRKNKRHNADPSYLNVYSEGPQFSPSFAHKIAELNGTTLEFEVSDNQEVYLGDLLTIKLTLTATNEGTAIAYNAKFNLKIDKNAEYIKTNQTTKALTVTEGEVEGDEKLFTVFYKGQIEAGGEIKCDLYFKVQFGERTEQVDISRRRLADEKDKVSLVKELDMSLCLTNALCQPGQPEYGQQKSDATHSISYKKNIVRDVGKIILKAENIGNDTNPIYKLEAEVQEMPSGYTLSDMVFVFYRKIEGIDVDYVVIARSNNPTYIDTPFDDMDEIKSYNITYKVKGEFPNGRTLDSVTGENKYNDIYQLMEENEKEKEKKGFPTYAIALIVVLGLALLAGAAFLTYKLLAKKSVEVATMAVSENPEAIKPYSGEQFQKVEPSSPRVKKKRNLKNSSVISMEPRIQAN